MKYSNPKIPEGINYSKENPLKEFFMLVVSVFVVLISVVFLIYFLAQSFAQHIPFRYESKLVSVGMQQGFFSHDLTNEKQQYIADLGHAIAEKMALPDDMRVHIYYADDELVNAFASLNGLIVINQGLIDFVESENELAFIIAHEIAHVKERHPIKSLSSGLIVSLALSAIIGSDMSGAAATIGNTAMLGALSFSRKNELSADAVALEAMQQYYGHISGSMDFFSRLNEEGNSPELLDFLSTHPGHEKRMSEIQRISTQLGLNSDAHSPLVAVPEFMRQTANTSENNGDDNTNTNTNTNTNGEG